MNVIEKKEIQRPRGKQWQKSRCNLLIFSIQSMMKNGSDVDAHSSDIAHYIFAYFFVVSIKASPSPTISTVFKFNCTILNDHTHTYISTESSIFMLHEPNKKSNRKSRAVVL